MEDTFTVQEWEATKVIERRDQMLFLTEADKRKLEGRVNLSHGENETAIKWFNRSLELETDPEIYFYLAYAYCYLREYRKARDYALLAIEGGYDAYALYTKISVGNLQDVYGAIKILKKGVEKRYFSACIEMAKLHVENTVLPDMIDPYEASNYLEKAYQCAPIEKRGTVAYMISKWYRILYSKFPDYFDFKSEVSELYFLNICYEYGAPLYYPKEFNIELFDVANKNDDYGVIQMLFDKFDGDAMFIFALLLLYEEYSTTGTIVITKNQGLLTACEGALKYKHGGCYALTALCYGSDFEGSEFDSEQAIKSLECSRQNHFSVPKTLESFYEELMNHLYSSMTDGSFGFMA